MALTNEEIDAFFGTNDVLSREQRDALPIRLQCVWASVFAIERARNTTECQRACTPLAEETATDGAEYLADLAVIALVKSEREA
jgi:hypothetical protein